MGKIFIVIGKSASGKDSVYSLLMKNKDLDLTPFVIYTTRPKRSGEMDGREYFFTDAAHLAKLRDSGRVIEERVYHTVHGDWYYFTADEGRIDPEKNYLGIGTLESFIKLKKYFGDEKAVPLYIECSDKARLLRSAEREARQDKPSYAEVCRRFLADEEDFSEEKLEEAGITIRFHNDESLEKCAGAVEEYLASRI